MLTVNFRKYDFRFQTDGNKRSVFDITRKKYVALTPEEWVRQHWLHFIVFDRNYPKSLIKTEHSIKWNGLEYRCDIVVFNRTGEPIMIIECKAPDVPITDKTAWQITRYNQALKVDHLVLSNGSEHLCYQLSSNGDQYEAHSTVPEYNKIA